MDPQLKEMGLQSLNRSWDWGWDKTYGGINYFKDCKNFPPQEYWHDMKFWWPQCEAVIATLYAYQATGDAKYLEMHKLINDYTFNHLPDKEYGEWWLPTLDVVSLNRSKGTNLKVCSIS